MGLERESEVGLIHKCKPSSVIVSYQNLSTPVKGSNVVLLKTPRISNKPKYWTPIFRKKPSKSYNTSSSKQAKLMQLWFSADIKLNHEIMAVGRGGRSLMGPFLVINLVVYLIVLGLAGWSLDKYIDGEQNHPRMSPHLTSLNCFFLK